MSSYFVYNKKDGRSRAFFYAVYRECFVSKNDPGKSLPTLVSIGHRCKMTCHDEVQRVARKLDEICKSYEK